MCDGTEICLLTGQFASDEKLCTDLLHGPELSSSYDAHLNRLPSSITLSELG
jgi:hypothetical protein